MNKCDCYHVESEVRRFVDEDGGSVYGKINVPRCRGTKEKDVCDCGGDKTKCDFYPEKREKKPTKVKVRVVKTSDWLTRGMTDKELELEKNLALVEFKSLRALDKIEDLVLDYCGVDPAYLIGKDEEENELWKMCCKILEVVSMAKKEIEATSK